MSERSPSLEGRVAAITGASSGIGEATARRLAREGMDVAIGARRGKRLSDIASEIEDEHGVSALPVEVDVRSMEAVQGFADEVEDTFGEVDLLFANAGTGGYGPVAETSEEAFEETIDVNLTGAFRTAKAFLPLVRAAEGTRTIAFTASVSGTVPMAGSSAYCASKHGLRGFARSLAQEVADEGIRATAINPGYVNTRWHEDHPRKDEMVQPEDVADLVVTLATMNDTALVDDVRVWPAKMFSE
jgi:NAD(P)-dependent dehydrogenase (short-subunit alcohol dehydrogenase family)